VSGRLGFDLGMKGPLRLSSLSGRVTLSGGRVTDVNAGLAFERTEAVATLARGVAQIAATSQLTTGGRLRVGGTIGLAAPYRADLALQLDSLMLRDPILYETTASGSLSLIGPLRAGARLAGRITLGQTELQIPSTGLGGAGALPGLTHRNEPAAVKATRGRAGLLASALADAGRGGGSLVLDLVIDAPSRVFVRGRGLDAELGGQLRLAGTTSSIIASGGFQLIRGRLDLLGKRLTLSRAILDLEGDFVPFVDVMASSTNDGITAIVTIEGPATNPVVSFSSSPELPQEEVLAQLLFGRDLQTITPLQAARLANAVRTLSGRGGEGLVGKLRRSFGLDDFDLATSADGTTTLRAGKYLSENVYTDIEVDQDGRSQINLNLDLRKGLTVTGRVSDDGETGLGVFLEQDY
jgi:translocation and assembly module TamB